MKNKIIMLLVMSIVICLPITVKATTVEIKLACPEKAKSGEEVECVIKAKTTDGVLGGISGVYEFEEGVTFKSFTPGEEWETIQQNTEKGFVIYNLNGVKADSEIGKLKIQLGAKAEKENYQIKLKEISLSDVDTNDIEHADVTATIKIDDSKEEENQDKDIPSKEENQDKDIPSKEDKIPANSSQTNPKTENNPKTADTNIMIYIGVGIAVLIILGISVKKVKAMK